MAARGAEAGLAGAVDRLPISTVGEAVAGRLRWDIVNGSIPLGSRLRQQQLALRYGVSTTPVREALRSLQAEGFVHLDAHRGAVVYDPTPRDVSETYELRVVLETLAAEKAVRQLTDEDCDEMQRLLHRLERSRDLESFLTLNRRFHMLLYERSRQRKLCEVIERLRDSCVAYVAFEFKSLGDTRRVAEHRAILDACRARDVEAVRTAVSAHLQGTVDRILRVIGAAAPSGGLGAPAALAGGVGRGGAGAGAAPARVTPGSRRRGAGWREP
jgi:DNA-binding GntR family transcriptional regulator